MLALLARRDWLRFGGEKRKVIAHVTGHRLVEYDGTSQYGAVFAFSDETGSHEVIDEMRFTSPRPPVGTAVELAYPAGRPELARISRPLIVLATYVTVVGLAGVCAALLAGTIR